MEYDNRDKTLLNIYEKSIEDGVNPTTLRKRIDDTIRTELSDLPPLNKDAEKLFKCLIEHFIRVTLNTGDISYITSMKPLLSFIQENNIETIREIISGYPDMEQDVLQEYDDNVFRNTLHNLKYVTGQWMNLDFYDEGVLIRNRFEVFKWLNQNVNITLKNKYGVISDTHNFFDETIPSKIGDDEISDEYREYIFTKIAGLRGNVISEKLSYKNIYESITGEPTDEDKKNFSIMNDSKFNKYYDISIHYERKDDEKSGYVIDTITILLIPLFKRI